MENATLKELEDNCQYINIALSKILRHQIIKTSDGQLRWKKTTEETPDLNDVCAMYSKKEINLSIYLKIYMSIGYSLYGLGKIFPDPVLEEFIRINVEKKEFYPAFNLSSFNWKPTLDDIENYWDDRFKNLD